MADNFSIVWLFFVLWFLKPEILNIIFRGLNRGRNLSAAPRTVRWLLSRICLTSCSPPHASSSSFIICYALLSQYKLTSAGFTGKWSKTPISRQIRGCLPCTGVWMRFRTTPNKPHHLKKWAEICFYANQTDVAVVTPVQFCMFWNASPSSYPVWNTWADGRKPRF